MAIIASQICAPPLIPALCIEAGYCMRFGKFLTLNNVQSLHNASFYELGHMGLERMFEWLLGALIIGPFLAVIGGIVVYMISLCIQKAIQCTTRREKL